MAKRINALILLAVILLPALALADSTARISAVEILDEGQGSDGSSQSIIVDLEQGLCGVEPETTSEPFHDTLARFTVVNEGESTIRFTRAYFTLRSPYGAGGTGRSKRFAFVGSAEVEPDGEETALLSLFLDAQSGRKAYAGLSTAIPTSLGFRNVRFFLVGRDGRGNLVRISARRAISFDTVDRCG